MPGLVRKVLIFAAADGLILQPSPPRNHKPTTEQAIQIEYKTSYITPLLKDRRKEATGPSTLEVHGVLGLLKVASSSFLISIARREHVAQIQGKAIYSITDVALIPLSSQTDAETAIVKARDSQRRYVAEVEAGETSESELLSEDERDDLSLTEDNSVTFTSPNELEAASKANTHERPTSVAEDVISKKGMYGRFTGKWFSTGGWSKNDARREGISNREDVNELSAEQQLELTNPAPEEAQEQLVEEEGAPIDASKHEDNAQLPNEVPVELKHAVDDIPDMREIPLLPKLLTVTKLFFSSRSFFFSYDYDLSRSIVNQPTNSSSVPLFKTFDPLFFWNRRLAAPIIDAGQHNFVLPVIQGFVGQRTFTVDTSSDPQNASITSSVSKPEEVVNAHDTVVDAASHDLADDRVAVSDKSSQKQHLLTLVSRRSVKRAGLRYLRRGIDEEGNVANSVETEQILSSVGWNDNDSKTYSYLQYRGSIPVFFEQSPYSLKPLAILKGSWEQNAAAFRLHFQQLSARYGDVQVDSLVEKHGTEAKVGEAYEKQAKALNEHGGIDGKGKKLSFEWFDFHSVCRGMKFENVSQLFEILGPTLSSYSWSAQQNDQILKRQTGILRTNCMDCLDRTNVVQSACGRNVLEEQLKDLGITIDLQMDPKTAWFNSLWADNGDAISRQYAGTAALKGDFTRTRKRNISGALTDFGLTLSRYYNNIVNDFFAQNVIDYLLGRVDESIFIDFEADMKAQDYAVDLRKVRQSAIETCSRICIEDTKEDLLAGWTLSCPKEPNSLRSLPFEECVLLLTDQALYFCHMDWTTEKVQSFERIGLECVDAISRGTYITSTLGAREMDDTKNVGLMISFSTRGGALVRVNTRSLDSAAGEETKKKSTAAAKTTSQKDVSKYITFKVLPPKSSFASVDGQNQEPLSEIEFLKVICDEIAKVVNGTRKGDDDAPVAQDTQHVIIGGESPAGVDNDEENEEKQNRIVVEEKDIISLADAKKSTGYLEQLGYSLKKLVWAS